MKLMKTLLITFIAVASILFTAPTVTANGARGGAADLVGPAPVRSVTQPAAKTHHDCADCSNVISTRKVADGKKNEIKMVAAEQHLCSACKDTVQITGHGKATTSSPVHSCSMVASKSAGCCAK
jgi:hypothetical protein